MFAWSKNRGCQKGKKPVSSNVASWEIPAKWWLIIGESLLINGGIFQPTWKISHSGPHPEINRYLEDHPTFLTGNYSSKLSIG